MYFTIWSKWLGSKSNCIFCECVRFLLIELNTWSFTLVDELKICPNNFEFSPSLFFYDYVSKLHRIHFFLYLQMRKGRPKKMYRSKSTSNVTDIVNEKRSMLNILQRNQQVRLDRESQTIHVLWIVCNLGTT